MESEKRLLACYAEMGINPIVLSGTMEERLTKALEVLHIKPEYPIEYYIRHATIARRDRFDKVNLET